MRWRLNNQITSRYRNINVATDPFYRQSTSSITYSSIIDVETVKLYGFVMIAVNLLCFYPVILLKVFHLIAIYTAVTDVIDKAVFL